MKTQKLSVIAAIIMLMAVAGVSCTSSNAAAPPIDCPGGTIIGGEYDGIQISSFVSCKIVGAVVAGDVVAEGADQIIMIGNTVSGKVSITNTVNADLVGNQLLDGDIVIKSNAAASVIQNIVNNGSILVSDEVGAQQQRAAVLQNVVNLGKKVLDKPDW